MYILIEKPSPGTFYLSGELTYERPNIKLIFESRNDLTDLIVATFLECYREANKPNTATYKKNNFKEVGSQNNDENLMSKISKTIGGGDKRKEEAVNKLQEFGVTLFMPDSKSVDYDWVYNKNIRLFYILHFNRIILLDMRNKREI